MTNQMLRETTWARLKARVLYLAVCAMFVVVIVFAATYAVVDLLNGLGLIRSSPGEFLWWGVSKG